MPVLTLVRHLALVDADRLAAAVAVLGEGGVEASETVRPALPHHVPLPAELRAEEDAREFTNRPRRWKQAKRDASEPALTRMDASSANQLVISLFHTLKESILIK